MVVAPSMSGGTVHPYIASLTEETAADLDGYVPVAPVRVSILSDATISPAVLENLKVSHHPDRTVSMYGIFPYATTSCAGVLLLRTETHSVEMCTVCQTPSTQ